MEEACPSSYFISCWNCCSSFPSMVTLGLGGYSALDTKFPPVVCFASNRDVTAYMLLIPLGVLIALIITELILIFHFLVRYNYAYNV